MMKPQPRADGGPIPLLVFGVGSLLSLLAAAPASAGVHAYHSGDSSICSDCHPKKGPSTGATGTGRERNVDDPSEVCLRCHDGRLGVPDVVGADINNLAERSGGFFAPMSAGNPRGHELARRTAPAGAESGCGRCHAPTDLVASPGNVPAIHGGLSCIDCHDPHGNDNPRNIRLPSAGKGSSPPLGLFTAPGARGLDRYERKNVSYGTFGSDRLREVSALCRDCHAELADAAGLGSDGRHAQHPSYDSQSGDLTAIAQGAVHGSTDPGHWSRGTGSGFDGTTRLPFLGLDAGDFETASVVDPARNSVFCLSCHKAHGSGNPFGLTWAPEGRGIGPRGCDQCHGLAAPSAGGGLTAEVGPSSLPGLPPQVGRGSAPSLPARSENRR